MITEEQLRANIRYGDIPRIAEAAGKKEVTVRHIMAGHRRMQPWLLEAAERYFRFMRRME